VIDLSGVVIAENIILRLAGVISLLVNIEIDVSVSSNHVTPSLVEESIFHAVTDKGHFLISALTEVLWFMIDLSSFVITEKIILCPAGQ
jgi:hypothetical protein